MKARKKQTKTIKSLTLISIMLCLLLISTGCKEEEASPKVKDLEFTVVPDSDLPEALATLIEDKKTGDMMLTYATDNELYIVRGYGTRPTDGYNITVDQCYLTDDRIYFETSLTGPPKGSNTTSLPSFPYIVIKTEYLDIPVDFE